MKILKTTRQLKAELRSYRKKKWSLGFVPTMGALHQGHLRLIRQAQKENDKVVVSIFVNPLQFGQGEDFQAYPQNLETDLKKCRQAGVDIAFIPDAARFLKLKALKPLRISYMSRTLCARYRPGHFDGVATIVALFFRLVEPTRAYFGMKDYQQCRILEEMTRREFKDRIEIVLVSTVRDRKGLAVSSRNRYLTPPERRLASRIYETLQWGQRKLLDRSASTAAVIQAMRRRLEKFRAMRVQYIELVDAKTLEPLSTCDESSSRQGLLAAAVYLGKARLIDSILV